MRRVVMSRSTTRSRGAALARVSALAVAGLVLAGCTGGGGGPSEPEGPTGPVNLVGVECEALIDLDAVRGILNDSVELVDDFYYPGGSYPMASVGVRQAGGMLCEWSDAANQVGDYEALVEVDVVPNASGAWDAWFDEMTGFYQSVSDDGARLSMCSSSLGGSYHYCRYEVLAGGHWATVSVSNIAADADASFVAESVAAALGSATAPDAEWTPPQLAAMPASCEELLPLETVRTVLGVDDMAEREAPLIMPYLHNVGLDGALNCSWSNPYSSAVGSPLQAVVMPGGSWAWDEAWAAGRPDHSPAEAVEGLGDAAFVGCQEVDNPTCFLDLLVGDAWVSLDGKGAVTEHALTEMASELLSTLRP